MGNIVIHCYQPGERREWDFFERNLLEMLRWEARKHGGDRLRAIKAIEERVRKMVEKYPQDKAKYQYHADNAGKAFLEDKSI